MGDFEKKYILFNDYSRFIDEIFSVITHGMDKLMEFIEHLNQ